MSCWAIFLFSIESTLLYRGVTFDASYCQMNCYCTKMDLSQTDPLFLLLCYRAAEEMAKLQKESVQ